jgi:hypothetical protein
LDGGKSVRLEDLEKELEAYASLINRETKCEKTYKCPMRNCFECPLTVRTVRELVTGSVLIEKFAMSHYHDDSNEQFQRGLSFCVQEIIWELTKFDIKIRPQTLHRSLLMDPYNFSGEDVPVNKVSSY